jgi:hypothetical protein
MMGPAGQDDNRTRRVRLQLLLVELNAANGSQSMSSGRTDLKTA